MVPAGYMYYQKQVTPRDDLALPNAMGLQPGSITVTDAGLTIGFVPKPPTQ